MTAGPTESKSWRCINSPTFAAVGLGFYLFEERMRMQFNLSVFGTRVWVAVDLLLIHYPAVCCYVFWHVFVA